MALARLCQNLATTRPDLNLGLKAFIVDHGARSGSAAEALKVARLLRSFSEHATQALIPPSQTTTDKHVTRIEL